MEPTDFATTRIEKKSNNVEGNDIQEKEIQVMFFDSDGNKRKIHLKVQPSCSRKQIIDMLMEHFNYKNLDVNVHIYHTTDNSYDIDYIVKVELTDENINDDSQSSIEHFERSQLRSAPCKKNEMLNLDDSLLKRRTECDSDPVIVNLDSDQEEIVYDDYEDSEMYKNNISDENESSEVKEDPQYQTPENNGMPNFQELSQTTSCISNSNEIVNITDCEDIEMPKNIINDDNESFEMNKNPLYQTPKNNGLPNFEEFSKKSSCISNSNEIINIMDCEDCEMYTNNINDGNESLEIEEDPLRQTPKNNGMLNLEECSQKTSCSLDSIQISNIESLANWEDDSEEKETENFNKQLSDLLSEEKVVRLSFMKKSTVEHQDTETFELALEESSLEATNSPIKEHKELKTVVSSNGNSKDESRVNFLNLASLDLDESSSELPDSLVQISDSPLASLKNRSSRDGEKILTIYPEPPKKGGISINTADFNCLAAGQFLNDVIIDFYLKYLQEEVLSLEDRQRTHIFSSHFYTRLIKASPVTADELGEVSLSQKRHNGVQRWTKNVNIFEKDFVIVPINENYHWYLAIICFPGLVGIVGEALCDFTIKGTEKQRPCILIFDSLSGSRKAKVSNLLREYLSNEYFSKAHENKLFTGNFMKIVHPEIPTQSNATDCGLYLLQYVEQFFKKPILNYSWPISDLTGWFPKSTITNKRKEIACIISNLAKKYHNGDIDIPVLKFPKEPTAFSFLIDDDSSNIIYSTSESSKSLEVYNDENDTFATRPKRKITKVKPFGSTNSDSASNTLNICDTDDSDDDNDIIKKRKNVVKTVNNQSKKLAARVVKKTHKNEVKSNIHRYRPLQIDITSESAKFNNATKGGLQSNPKQVSRGHQLVDLVNAADNGDKTVTKWNKMRRLYNPSDDFISDPSSPVNSRATTSSVHPPDLFYNIHNSDAAIDPMGTSYTKFKNLKIKKKSQVE